MMNALRHSRIFGTAGLVSVSLGAILAVIAAPNPAMAQTAAAEQVTFAKDVAPILQRSCQACHRPGSIAPMSLVTYEETRPWARSIKERVAARKMPPWFIDRHVGVRGSRPIAL